MNHTRQSEEYRFAIESAISDFVKVALLAGYSFCETDLVVEFHECPHRAPSKLPQGKMALYSFHDGKEWLKIGIAGSKSQARYTSQHYNAGSAPSTLAASLIRDSQKIGQTFDDLETPGSWIKANCHRVNILIDEKFGRPLLVLLESFLHARLKPRYER